MRQTADHINKRGYAVVDYIIRTVMPQRLVVRMLFTKEAISSKDERHFAKVGEI